MVKVSPLRGKKVVQMPGLTAEQGQFIAAITDEAIEHCTKGDSREWGFVLLVVGRENAAGLDDHDLVSISTLSTFEKDNVIAILHDYLSRNRH